MAVTEQQRHRLLTWFEEHMGQDLGASMMELLPPADGSQLATQGDLALLRGDVTAFRVEIRTELAEGRTQVAELRAEVKDDFVQLQRTFGTWLYASQAAVITVVGVVTALT